MNRLSVFVFLFPVSIGAVATDLPVSVELDAGVGVASMVREQSDLLLPYGNRVLVSRREEIGESPVGSFGATVRYRFRDHLDAYARLDWRGAWRIDQDYDYAFSNGDYITGTNTAVQRASASQAAIGMRRTALAGGCWSTEWSADLRHLDNDFYSEYPNVFGGPPLSKKSEDGTAGIGIGAAFACRIAEQWSVLLGGEAALLEEYEQYAASLSLRWIIR